MGFHLWGLEGVVGGEVNCKEKHPTLVRAVWGAHDCGLKRGWMESYSCRMHKPASETDPLQQVLHCIEQVGPFQGPDIRQFEDFVEQMTETQVLKTRPAAPC